MIQIWKDVRDYEGLYQVSNFGRVKSLNYKHYGKEQILKITKDGQNYCVINLSKNKNYKGKLVHILVFEAFYRRLLPNEEVHHLNEVRDCNLSTNLVAKDKILHVKEHKKNISQQTRIKMSNAQKGKKKSQQTKRKMSESHKGKKRGPYNKK